MSKLAHSEKLLLFLSVVCVYAIVHPMTGDAVVPAAYAQSVSRDQKRLNEAAQLGGFMGRFGQIYQRYVAALDLLDPLIPLSEKVMAGRVSDTDARQASKRTLALYDAEIADLARQVARLNIPSFSFADLKDAAASSRKFLSDVQGFMADYRASTVDMFEGAMRGDANAVDKAELNGLARIRFLLEAENELMDRQSLLVPPQHPQGPLIELLKATNSALVHLLTLVVEKSDSIDETSIRSAVTEARKELSTNDELLARGARYNVITTAKVRKAPARNASEKRLIKRVIQMLETYDTSFEVEKKISARMKKALVHFEGLSENSSGFLAKWQSEFAEIQQLINERLRTDQLRKQLLARLQQR